MHADALRYVAKFLLYIIQSTEQICSFQIVSLRSISRLEDEVENHWQQQHVILRFLNAVGYCSAAHTDIICYLLAIVNHARCAGIISLPLPLLIFFWGSLTNPRPTKMFWVIVLEFVFTESSDFLTLC